MDSMQVHGKLNVQGPLNLRQGITNMAESFSPITEAAATLNVNSALILKQEAALIAAHPICFLLRFE